jgi:hypothetical protein
MCENIGQVVKGAQRGCASVRRQKIKSLSQKGPRRLSALFNSAKHLAHTLLRSSSLFLPNPQQLLNLLQCPPNPVLLHLESKPGPKTKTPTRETLTGLRHVGPRLRWRMTVPERLRQRQLGRKKNYGKYDIPQSSNTPTLRMKMLLTPPPVPVSPRNPPGIPIRPASALSLRSAMIAAMSRIRYPTSHCVLKSRTTRRSRLLRATYNLLQKG